MLKLLTAATLCFALAFAQTDDETNTPAVIAAQGNNETDPSPATTTASATYTGGRGHINLPPGAVAMIPATESSDSELYVPTSTATPASHEPASFSYEPDTTTDYEPSSTVFYYEPTTTPYRKPIVESTRTAVEHPVYSQSSSYADYTGPYAPDVVRTESSDDSLAMPTPSSSKEYNYPPPHPTKESPPPPAFTYAPTTPYQKPAQTTPIVYAPSSKHEAYPAPSSNTTPIPVAPTTPYEEPAQTPPIVYAPSSKHEAYPAPSSHTTPIPIAPVPATDMPTPAAPSVSKQTVYVQPAPVSQPGTLTSKVIPLYSETSTGYAKPQTTEEPLTYDHNTPTPSSTEHVMTYKGHTISLGPATLAAEPTGWMPEGGRASPSGSASLQGAGVRVGGRGLGCAAVAMAAGMAAFFA